MSYAMMAIRVVLVDDSPAPEKALQLPLAADRSIQLVSVVSTYMEAIWQCTAVEPDVVILNLSPSEKGSTEAAIEISKRSPNTKALIVSDLTDAEHIHSALEAGVRGYLASENAPRMLVATVKRLHSGATVLGPVAAKAIACQGSSPYL